MEAERLKSIVERHINRAMGELGVPHWRVSVEYGKTDHDHWAAQIDRSGGDYWQAGITMYPDGIDDAEFAIKCLYHELAHLVLAPFDVYRNTVAFSAKGEPALWTHCVEQTVTCLERGLLAPLIDRAIEMEREFA